MVEMKIKGGTQPDSKLLLRDKGVPFLHQPSRRGNHYVTVHIDIPTSLTDRQRQLLEEYIAEGQPPYLNINPHINNNTY